MLEGAFLEGAPRGRDLWPDELVAMVEELGGAVLPLGHGVGHTDLLDDCGAVAAAELHSPAKAEELLAQLHSRRRDLLASRISPTDPDLRAATLLVCWSAGFKTVTTSNMPADDGVIGRHRFLVIHDEPWSTLAAGPSSCWRSGSPGRSVPSATP